MGTILRNGIAYGGGGAGGSDIEVLTQEAYDALVAAGTVDNDKYYFIEDDPDNVFDLEILDTMDEVVVNTKEDVAAGALALKEYSEAMYAALDLIGSSIENQEEKLEQLEMSFQDGCSTIAGAITEMGVTTAANASPEEMAANIRQIVGESARILVSNLISVESISSITWHSSGTYNVGAGYDNAYLVFTNLRTAITDQSIRINQSYDKDTGIISYSFRTDTDYDNNFVNEVNCRSVQFYAIAYNRGADSFAGYSTQVKPSATLDSTSTDKYYIFSVPAEGVNINVSFYVPANNGSGNYVQLYGKANNSTSAGYGTDLGKIITASTGGKTYTGSLLNLTGYDIVTMRVHCTHSGNSGHSSTATYTTTISFSGVGGGDLDLPEKEEY